MAHHHEDFERRGCARRGTDGRSSSTVVGADAARTRAFFLGVSFMSRLSWKARLSHTLSDRANGRVYSAVRAIPQGEGGRHVRDQQQPGPPTASAKACKALRAKWGWIVALGIIFMIAGVIALGSVVMATETAVLVVGIMMIMAGVAEIVSAFNVKDWGKFALWLLLGAALCRGRRHLLPQPVRGRHHRSP